MNILHVVNGNITVEDGYTQRVKRQQWLWKKDLSYINLSVFNTLDWHLLKNPWKIKECIHESRMYCDTLSAEYRYCQGFPMAAFVLDPDHYFIYCAKKIKQVCDELSIDLLYTENLMCSYMGYWCNKLFGLPYIMDYHGVAPEEYQIGGKKYGRVDYNYYKKIEKLSLQNASGVVCVSHRFKNYLVETFSIKDKSIIISPSCVQKDRISFDETIRASMRKRLGLESKKVLIYAGGIGNWHCDQDIIKIFSQLYVIDDSLFFIFLTAQKNQDAVKDSFDRFNVNPHNYYINSVSNTEVNQFYAAADYGIIVRFDSLVNEVASPTKVIEYLANGLAIISTTNIGDIKQMPGTSYLFDYKQISEDSLDISDLLDFINKGYDREENYMVCEQFIKDEYTWEAMSDRYRYLFNLVTQ